MAITGPEPADDRYRDREWLYEKYVEQQYGIHAIADMIDVSHSSISRWLDKHGIQKRDRSFEQPPDGPYSDPEWLREKYHGEGMTAKEMAESLGCSKRTVLRWMEKHGIERRRSGETLRMRGMFQKEDNPNWKGGYTRDHFYDSTKWRETRESVWERDGFVCYNCGSLATDPVAHHIIPKDEVDDPFDKSNIITWCRSCHSTYHASD